MQNPMVPYFQRVDVPGSLVERSVTHRHTDTHTCTDYCNPLAHAPRVNDELKQCQTMCLIGWTWSDMTHMFIQYILGCAYIDRQLDAFI